MPANPQELQQFMNAIGYVESRNNYQAPGDDRGSRYGVAYGRYQIMSGIWPGWAREAGYAGADPRDPRAQDAVAAFKMNQYWERYKSWPLVALAWFAGPGAANKAMKNGINSLSNVHDGGNKGEKAGTSVPDYVQKVMAQFAGGTFDPSSFPEADRQGAVQAQQGLQGVPQPAPKSTTRSLAQASINALSEQLRNNPGNDEVRSRIQQAFSRLYGHGEPQTFQQPMQGSAPAPSNSPTQSSPSVRTTSSGQPSPAPAPAPESKPPKSAPGIGQSGAI